MKTLYVDNCPTAKLSACKMTGCLFIVVLIFTSCTFVNSQENVTISTKKGPIVGIRVSSHPATQASYDAFIGIPYGQIPARFQLAIPRDSWSTPLVTQTDGPACPQPNTTFDEDCLYLNVYTPRGASEIPGKLAVMAFIFGGGFTVGSSSSKHYGPDFLVPAGVILVTMNYRLGALGFLTLGSNLAPGNLGLHDTALALQWIQEEISVFGGDPAQVTLFGGSAGSAMTQFHYLSPTSSELFSKAIAQSGSALAEWSHVTVAKGARRGRLLAQAVGCNVTENDSAILACLQKTDVNSIVGNQSLSNIYLSTKRLAVGNIIPFVPVLDTDQTAEKPFFGDTISNLMELALERAKPLLTGFNLDEGFLMVYLGHWQLAEENLDAFVPKNTAPYDKKDLLTSNIKKKYFPETPDQNKLQDVVQLYTDYMFAYPGIKISRYFANFTYGYLFAFDGSWPPPTPSFSRYKLSGVNHGEEMYYLFYRTGAGFQYFDTCPGNTANLNMTRQMVIWWTSFARTGIPDPSWKTISSGRYLLIDTNRSIINSSDLESQYYNFWEAMQPTPSSSASSSSILLTNTSLLLFIIAATYMLNNL